LNRKRNPHTRSVFILGSADKPPLRPRIANVAICLGTLHHMRAKEKGLSTIAELVFEGVMLLSDPINGHFLPERFRFSRASRSAHDDSIDYAEFRRSADSLNLRLDYERQFSGFVYYLLMKSLRPLLLKSQRLHNSAHMLDEILIKTLGGVIPILRPRALITALSKKVEVHQTGGTVLSNYAIGGA
jgi:hypothetical protein